jgi:hypothetical protein
MKVDTSFHTSSFKPFPTSHNLIDLYQLEPGEEGNYFYKKDKNCIAKSWPGKCAADVKVTAVLGRHVLTLKGRKIHQSMNLLRDYGCSIILKGIRICLKVGGPRSQVRLKRKSGL